MRMSTLHALILLLWAPFVLPWTVSTGADLAWPPLVKSGYFTINSQIVGGDPALFPCNQPLTGNEPRTIFPITGGQLQWNLTNSTGEHPDFYFVINIYLSQISADTSSYHNMTAYATNDVWQNFTTGMECGGEVINATQLVNEALNGNYKDSEVVGMNATFGLRSVLFTHEMYYPYPTDIYNIEEMYQCAYVTFVSDNTPKADFGGACISMATSSTSRTTPVATAMPTTTSQSLRPASQRSRTSGSTVTSFQSNPTSSSSSEASNPTPYVGTTSSSTAHVRSIGLGVGISVGVCAILFALGCTLFRRRRKHGGTLALDFWVHGRESEDGSGKDTGDKKEKKKGEDGGKDGTDSSGSVHGEQLPAYGDVTGGTNRDLVLKSSPKTEAVDG